jgi:hypothetical protein
MGPVCVELLGLSGLAFQNGSQLEVRGHGVHEIHGETQRETGILGHLGRKRRNGWDGEMGK